VTYGASAAAVVALLALTGCGAVTSGDSEQPLSDSAAGGVMAGPADEGSTAMDTGAPATDEAKAAGNPLNVTQVERDVIRTASVRVRADDVAAAATQAAGAARGLGGLVGAEQVVIDPDDADRTTATMTLRVPSARLDDLLTQIRGLGTVLEQTQQAEDVTGQVADIGARVEAQRASVRRIQALLARANTIGEVVTVEAQLAQRQADLESLEAQQKALSDQTTLATLQVSFVGPTAVVPVPDDETGFLAGLDRGWTAFTAAVTASLTTVGVLVPFVGFALVIGLPLVAWARARSRRTPAISPDASSGEPTPESPQRESQPVG
jgi:hypothetical protein